MARQRIEPGTIRVTLPTGRTYYKKALDRMLLQGKLKAELRVDEADGRSSGFPPSRTSGGGRNIPPAVELDP